MEDFSKTPEHHAAMTVKAVENAIADLWMARISNFTADQILAMENDIQIASMRLHNIANDIRRANDKREAIHMTAAE